MLFHISCVRALLLGASGFSPAPEATRERGAPRNNRGQLAVDVCNRPLATLLARLVALLVGVLLAFLVLAVEKTAGHPHPSPDGRSQPGIAGDRTNQRPSRGARGAASQGALPRR